MSAVVQHLFADPEADARDERKRQRRERAHHQSRCPSCGRFAPYPQEFVYDVICRRCLDDPRPAIVGKVQQVREWWGSLHPQAKVKRIHAVDEAYAEDSLYGSLT